MSGYYRADALNAAAFDEEGYFRTGDAVRWVDPARPIEGLEFAGRIAEDFKLLSGTWVQASIVRRDLVEALQPYVSDAVICAPDHPWLGALVWLTAPDDARLRSGLAQKLAAFNQARQGSADTIARLLILKESSLCQKPVKSPTSAPSTRGWRWSAARTKWPCCTRIRSDASHRRAAGSSQGRAAHGYGAALSTGKIIAEGWRLSK